jgi:hypothetical protein
MEVTKWLNRRVEGEAFPLNENVAGKPAEPKPPNPATASQPPRGEADDDQCAGHCRSAASDH